MHPLQYRWLTFFVGSCFLGLLGCGLQDYQQRMDVERLRMQIFDEEDKALEGPIELPMRKTKDKEIPAWPFEVFVRPPKGFERTAKDSFNFQDVNLYRFAGPPGFNFFVAASKIGEMTKDKVFLEGELSLDQFRRRVAGAVAEFYMKDTKGFQLPQMIKIITTPEKHSPKSAKEKLPDQDFDKLEILDRPTAKEPTHFLVYFHRTPVNQVALVYQLPKKDLADPNFQFNLKYSLTSLDITDKAPTKRQDFLATRRTAPAPKKEP